jgi:hypothetical protein
MRNARALLGLLAGPLLALGAAAPAATAAPLLASAGTAGPGAVTKLTGTPEAVTVPSATDAWATMGTDVMLHWNGTAWAKVRIGSAGGGAGELDGVMGVSPTDVWAVGSIFVKAFTTAALTVHWNGKSWTRVATPSLSSENFLNSVSATSATNTWAVGYHMSKAGAFSNLVLHWNGTSWTKVATPPPASEPPPTGLNAVISISPSDAWAVGDTQVLHWNGTTWNSVTVPAHDPTFALSAASASDIWAVGDGASALHFNGTTWTAVTVPAPGGPSTNALTGVAAISPSLAFADGTYSPPHSKTTEATLLLQWNGTKWTRVPTPNPGTPGGVGSELNGVAASSPSNAWAAGEYSTGQPPGNVWRTLMMHWNGSSWIRS